MEGFAYALGALLGYTGIELPMEYNSVGIGKPHIDSIGSEPGIEDLSEPALRVPDGDSLPGELVDVLKVRRTASAVIGQRQPVGVDGSRS